MLEPYIYIAAVLFTAGTLGFALEPRTNLAGILCALLWPFYLPYRLGQIVSSLKRLK